MSRRVQPLTQDTKVMHSLLRDQIPEGHVLLRTDTVVGDVELYPFKWAADRRAQQGNDARLLPTFRYEVRQVGKEERKRWHRFARWAVVPMQNVLRPRIPLGPDAFRLYCREMVGTDFGLSDIQAYEALAAGRAWVEANGRGYAMGVALRMVWRASEPHGYAEYAARHPDFDV